MSRSTEDNLGRRRFLLHRDKAVEQALERIRHAPHAGLDMLSSEELAGLRLALSDIWENCGYERWQQYCFSTLTKPDLLNLITLVSTMRERHSSVCDAWKAVEEILLSCSGNHRPHENGSR
jgi:hypothetical protein